MEDFRSNFMRNCREIGISPSDIILNVLRERTRQLEVSTSSEVGLDFSGNSLTVQDCAVLAKTLANDKNIQELRFSDCLLTEEACKLLLSYLPSNRGVKKLDLKGNNIRSCAELIGRILKRTPTLTHLSLEWNGIGLWHSGLAAIAEGLQVNQTLRYLDLRNNQVSHEGATFLANALKINRILKIIDLRWNNVGMLGAQSFISNNIPNDLMKAIESALQRNVDCQASYQEQKALSETYKHKLETMESDKNLQISSLVDKISREKDMFTNSVRSAQEKTEQLKDALDERRSAFSALQEKYSALESSYHLSEQTNKQKDEYIDSIKADGNRREKQHQNEVDKLKDQLSALQKIHEKAIKTEEDENSALRKKNKDLTDEICQLKSRLDNAEQEIKEKDFNYQKTLKDSDRKYSNEMNKMINEASERKQTDLEKIQKLEQANYRLEEELSHLKSKMMGDKLKAEEDSMNLRMTLKQEEMNRSRQFEERIEILQSARNELQIKNTKQSAEISDLQSRLGNNERETESLKRQCDHLKQQIDSKEAELRSEANKAKLEMDNAKRLLAQLQDKISDLEMKHSELEKRNKESLLSRDRDITYLRTQITNKDDELSRNRADEIKRAEVLENALQAYISNTKKLR
eukprot:gene3433-3928_t